VIYLYSYGTRIKARPPGPCYALDVRGIDNPHRPGRSETAKRELVAQHPLFPDAVARIIEYGGSQLSAAAYCTWGRHRSVTVIDYAARGLQVLGYDVYVEHLGRGMVYELKGVKRIRD